LSSKHVPADREHESKEKYWKKIKILTTIVTKGEKLNIKLLISAEVQYSVHQEYSTSFKQWIIRDSNKHMKVNVLRILNRTKRIFLGETKDTE